MPPPSPDMKIGLTFEFLVFLKDHEPANICPSFFEGGIIDCYL